MSAILMAALVLTPAAPALKARPPEIVTQILGEWIVEEWVDGDDNVAFVAGSSVTYFRDGKRRWTSGGMVDEDRSYSIDARTKPASVELRRGLNSPTPTVRQGIVKIEKDRLVLCYGPREGERPTSFDTAGTANTRLTFRRAAAK